jgi:putative ABC transport system substrate-binding protein
MATPGQSRIERRLAAILAAGMKRREFITLLGGAAAWPGTASSQQPAMPVIGFLHTTEAYPPSLHEFHNALAEAGFFEGRNVRIEYRWGGGQYDRLPDLAADLVRRRVDVIVAGGGGPSGRAAKAATNTIPIVVLSGGDPVQLGLVSALSHPGGNVTGVAQLVSAAEQKRLELLHELVPAAKTIAYLVNPTAPNAETQAQEIASEGRGFGVNVSVLRASSDDDITAAFGTIAQERVGALLVGNDAFFFMKRHQLVVLSARYTVPAMYFFRDFVTAGGLIGYGTRLSDAYHQIGVYTAQILKGANPADMPIVQQSEKIELIINLKTAKVLGLDVPLSLLTRADELIE